MQRVAETAQVFGFCMQTEAWRMRMLTRMKVERERERWAGSWTVGVVAAAVVVVVVAVLGRVSPRRNVVLLAVFVIVLQLETQTKAMAIRCVLGSRRKLEQERNLRAFECLLHVVADASTICTKQRKTRARSLGIKFATSKKEKNKATR